MGEVDERGLRVMQSFGAPRPTTNPYIRMLDDALAATPGLDHVRFDRRRSLVGRYDAIHFHWPETLLGGSTRTRALVRRLSFAALLVRLRISRIAIVRTVHNVEIPRDVTPWERRMLQKVEDRADFRIVLNAQTGVDDPDAVALIPHGDFRAWFASVGAQDHAPDPDTIAFVGLVRRYKGVEQLVDAFAATSETDPGLRLRISGNPTSADLASEIAEAAASDARIALDLRFLGELEFADAIRRAEGVVLPYRFMHNSGTVLAVLSLGRPVLVPRNPVNEALAIEVGAGWVQMFDGELTPADLSGFLPRARAERSADAPDLSRREWTDVGAAHLAAYRRAVARRRGRSAT